MIDRFGEMFMAGDNCYYTWGGILCRGYIVATDPATGDVVIRNSKGRLITICSNELAITKDDFEVIDPDLN